MEAIKVSIFYACGYLITNNNIWGDLRMKVDSKLKRGMILSTYVFILIIAIIYIKEIFKFASTVVSLCSPFIVGFALAFLLKGLVKFYEEKVYTPLKFTNYKRHMSIITAYGTFFSFIVILVALVGPQIISSINILILEIPEQYEKFTQFSVEAIRNLNIENKNIADFWLRFEGQTTKMINELGKLAYSMLPSLLATTKSITTSIANVVFGFVISLYMLANKEKLQSQSSRLLRAVVGETIEKPIVYVASLMNKTLSNFIVGQVTEAFILGTMCFIGMTIFGMPYKLLLSILIGASNLIPIFGPIMCTIPATFIVLMANPTEPIGALWFLLLVLAVQRIDNDIVYPRVIGNSVGLSAIWVILAILVGGGLFGLMGMILGVPTMSVIYQLLREYTNKKLNNP